MLRRGLLESVFPCLPGVITAVASAASAASTATRNSSITIDSSSGGEGRAPATSPTASSPTDGGGDAAAGHDGGFGADFGDEDAGAGNDDDDEEAAVGDAAVTPLEDAVAGEGTVVTAVAADASAASTTAGKQTWSSSKTAGAAAVAVAPFIMWSAPHLGFPRLCAILGANRDDVTCVTDVTGATDVTPTHDVYLAALVEGLSTSVGGLSESVVKHSTAALLAWAGEAAGRRDFAALRGVGGALLGLLRARPRPPWEEYIGGPSLSSSSSSASSTGGAAGLNSSSSSAGGLSAASRGRAGSPAASAGGRFSPAGRRAAGTTLPSTSDVTTADVTTDVTASTPGHAASDMPGPAGSSARDLGGYSSSFDPTMSRWFANILGAASGSAGSARGIVEDPNTYIVDSRLVVPALRTLDVLLASGHMEDVLSVAPPPAQSFSTGSSGPLVMDLQAKDASPSTVVTTTGSAFAAEVVDVVARRIHTGWEDTPRVVAAASVLFSVMGSGGAPSASPTPIPAAPGSTQPPSTDVNSSTQGGSSQTPAIPLPPSPSSGAVGLLLELLGHPFPRVRKTTAEGMYVRLLTLEGTAGWGEAAAAPPSFSSATDGVASTPPSATERHAEVVAILTSTPWESEDLAGAVLPPRDHLYALLGVLPPGVKEEAGGGVKGKAGGGGGGGAAPAADDYGALVREMGY